MTPPVIPFGSFGALQGSSTAGMRHQAQRVNQPTIELPDEETEDIGEPTLEEPFCCLLTETDFTPAQIAASNGVLTRWHFRPERGIKIEINSVYRVTGCDEDDCEWVETVEIKGHVKKHGRVLRIFGANDVQLDK